MALSWNEIKDRALTFVNEWKGTHNEEADAKPFLDALFNIFGISRRKIASFEHRIKKLDEHDGYIDLLWKGTILIEMKSRGRNLDKAYQQAIDYTHGLKQHELPRYILVSDFEIFRLYDLEEDTIIEFKFNELIDNIQHFGFIAGYQKHVYKEQDPANIQAAELMGKLHDRLLDIGYIDHPLEVYLVRILFCLFAEDTTIFEKQQFQEYIEQRTAEDGSDLASKLQELFQVLNTTKDKRFKNLDEHLAAFPYVNGKLFEEVLPIASFDSKMRQALLNCCYLDWSKISPAIFGSMFQSVMNPQERRDLGAHYTSEKNILKLIKPLFLDALWKEFESIKGNKNKLTEFHKRLSTMKFFDPACGCGNFLVITYRELRLLELEILRTIYKTQQVTSVEQIIWLDVDQFYGIEYEEFPARIAEVAMWLIDHQMNMLISQEFGQYFVRLPLKKAATIIHGNALNLNNTNKGACPLADHSRPLADHSRPLADHSRPLADHSRPLADHSRPLADHSRPLADHSRPLADHSHPLADHSRPLADHSRPLADHSHPLADHSRPLADHSRPLADHSHPLADHSRPLVDWNDIIPNNECSFIISNPPFVGSKMMKQSQRDQIAQLFDNVQGCGVLDYVTAWYIKAARYIQNTQIKVGFVSTNSIVQGEQTSILWGQLMHKYGIKIHFAHRTFKWSNEARGNAAVYCVIIGFANFDTNEKYIFEYEDIKGEPHKLQATNINPYLVDAKNTFIDRRQEPICDVPKMSFGNMPLDGGHLLLSDEEKNEFLKKEPKAEKYIKPLISAREFLNNEKRWCLWLVDANPSELKQMPEVLKRIALVKKFRLDSVRKQTIEKASIPYLFGEIRDFGHTYIVVPRVSSENRKYIPMGFFDNNSIAGDTCMAIPNGNLYHFGILSSAMHMAWVSYVCGRLKSDYRYSKDIVYNNYPWPETPTAKQIKAIEDKAQAVLDVRASFPNSSLADLYDPLTMPPELTKIHNALDKAVDLAYRNKIPFQSEPERMEFLFALYEKYTAGIFEVGKKVKRTNKSKEK